MRPRLVGRQKEQEVIGNSRDREAIASLQEAMQKLSTQVSAIASEVAQVTERHAESVSKADAFEDALARIRDELHELKAVTEARGIAEAERVTAMDIAVQEVLADRRSMAFLIAANTEQLEVQNAAITESAMLCDDQIRQCRGMLVRLERQAEADLTELRETNAALGSALLRLQVQSGLLSTD